MEQEKNPIRSQANRIQNTAGWDDQDQESGQFQGGMEGEMNQKNLGRTGHTGTEGSQQRTQSGQHQGGIGEDNYGDRSSGIQGTLKGDAGPDEDEDDEDLDEDVDEDDMDEDLDEDEDGGMEGDPNRGLGGRQGINSDLE